MHAFRKEILYTICLNIVSCFLDLMNPFLINEIIKFLKDPEAPLSYGVTIVSLMIVVYVVNRLIFQQISFSQAMTGVKSTIAVVAVIYEKSLKLSPATNKSFKQGEVVNFIQNDARKMAILTQYLPYFSKLPIAIVIAFMALFYILGPVMFLGILVTLVCMLANVGIGHFYN